MLDGIVNFQIAVTRLETRWKLSQNRSRREQELIAAQLEKSARFRRARARRADPQASDRRVKVVVLGAGLAGVTTAWYLAKEGHEVVVIDREREVAAAASYANTGIIAASRAYPWAGGELGRAMRQAALRFDPELWLWGMQHLFLRTGGSYRRVLEAKVRLVRYSQPLLHELAARSASR